MHSIFLYPRFNFKEIFLQLREIGVPCGTPLLTNESHSTIKSNKLTIWLKKTFDDSMKLASDTKSVQFSEQ